MSDDIFMAWVQDSESKWHLVTTPKEAAEMLPKMNYQEEQKVVLTIRLSNGVEVHFTNLPFGDCQDEKPYAETPEQADEILDRWING